MTRLATSFVTSDDLIIVKALVTGPRGTVNGHDDIDGLLGMNSLSDSNYEIRSSERHILVEKTSP